MNKIFHLVLYVLLSGLLACTGNSANKKTDTPAVPVTVANVSISTAIFYNSYPANIVALKEVEIRGQVTGYITGIFFEEGKKVHTGEKLYEIDRRKYEAAYKVTQSNVKIAEDNLEKVQRDADRYTDLSKQNAVAKQLYDNAMTDLKTARQQVDAANAEMVRAKTDYDYSLIYAPFDGSIGFSDVKLGSLVTPGQTLLNTVSSDDIMGVDFEISENELRRFEQLDNNAGPDNDTTFRIILPDNSTYPYPGKISVIDRAVDPHTGSIWVRITVSNKEGIIKTGMSCKVLVLNINAGQQIIIPSAAVIEQLGEYFVFRVNNNLAEQVKVMVGPRVNASFIILKGLSAGETIVVEGTQKLHDGAEVKPVEAKKQTNK